MLVDGDSFENDFVAGLLYLASSIAMIVMPSDGHRIPRVIWKTLRQPVTDFARMEYESCRQTREAELSNTNLPRERARA